MSPFSKKSFDSSKCVSLVEVTQKRLEILKKRRAIIVKQSRDDVAKLLERGQDANAAARAEHVFREENIVGAYELLEGYCHLVIKGMRAMRSAKECSSELKEAVASLIYAAPRCGDLQELSKVRELFAPKFGAEFVSSVLELRPGCGVNTQIIQKLSSSPPNADVRLRLLKDIALEYKLDWNYQRAVAISFKNGETFGKSKSLTNANMAPKGHAEVASTSNHADTNSKEPIRSLSEPVKPSNHSSICVRERDTMGVSGVSSEGSPPKFDNLKHQDKPKENECYRPRDSLPMRKGELIEKDAVGAEFTPTLDEQTLSLAKGHGGGSGVTPAENNYMADYQNHGKASIANVDEATEGKNISRSKLQSNKDHQNYVKASITKADEDSGGKNISQIKVPSNKGVVGPVDHKADDAHLQSPGESNFEMYRTGHHQAQYVKSSLQPPHRGQMGNSNHTKGESRIPSGIGSNETSVSGSGVAAAHQPENFPDDQKYARTGGSSSRRSIPPFEPNSIMVEMDQELADLKTTVGSAARAANAALEMVRTASMRSRANKKGLRQEPNSGTRSNYGSSDPKPIFESRKDLYSTVIEQNNMVNDDKYTGGTLKGQAAYKEPCQNQESVSIDSEMPYFDESSDNSSDTDPPPNMKNSRLPPMEDGAQKDFRKASSTDVKSFATPFGGQNRNKAFFDDDRVPSSESFGPNSSSQRNRTADVVSGLPPSFKTHLRGDADSNDVLPRSVITRERNAAHSAGAKNSSWSHGRAPNMDIASESIGKGGVLRWNGSSESGFDEKFGRDDVQPLSQRYEQHDVVAAQTNARKIQGVTARSVRTGVSARSVRTVGLR